MKNLIFFLLVLSCVSSFAQSFNDRIITNKNDTLNCTITLINDVNIFYDIKIRRRVENQYISRLKVKDYILHQNSTPVTILSQPNTNPDSPELIDPLNPNASSIPDKISNKYIIKSGTELKNFSQLSNISLSLYALAIAAIYAIPATPLIAVSLGVTAFIINILALQRVGIAGKYLILSDKENQKIKAPPPTK